MAKTNMLMREKRRLKVAKKYAARRAELKELIRDPKTGPEERAAAQAELQRSRAMRRRHRAAQSLLHHRALARRVPQVRLARTKLREAANRGEIPGLSKASW